METSIRKKVQDLLREIWQKMEEDNVYGSELSEYLVKLSSLMGDYGRGIVDLERKYINRQIEIMDEKDLSVAKSEVFVKVTDEYVEWKKAKELEKAIIESIRAIKYRIRVLQHEMEAGSNF